MKSEFNVPGESLLLLSCGMNCRNFSFNINIFCIQTGCLTSRIKLDVHLRAEYQTMRGPTVMEHTELVILLHFISDIDSDVVGRHFRHAD